MRVPLSLGVLLCLARAAVAADVSFTHAGYLLDAADQPATGALPMVFRIFDSPATEDANLLWTGNCTPQVERGRYAVRLGGGTCGSGLSDEVFAAGADRWLELEIDGRGLRPRLLLAPVPLAAHAFGSDTVGGKSLAQLVTKAELGTLPLAPAGTADATTYLRGDGTWAPLPLASATTAGVARAGAGLDVTDGTLAVRFGASAGTATAGDDPRLSDPRAPTGEATGDLGGTYPAPTVGGLQGRPVSAVPPVPGDVLTWDGAAWKPDAAAGHAMSELATEVEGLGDTLDEAAGALATESEALAPFVECAAKGAPGHLYLPSHEAADAQGCVEVGALGGIAFAPPFTNQQSARVASIQLVAGGYDTSQSSTFATTDAQLQGFVWDYWRVRQNKPDGSYLVSSEEFGAIHPQSAARGTGTTAAFVITMSSGAALQPRRFRVLPQTNWNGSGGFWGGVATFTLQGGHAAAGPWTTLLDNTAAGNGYDYSYPVTAAEAYEYFRFSINSTNGGLAWGLSGLVLD